MTTKPKNNWGRCTRCGSYGINPHRHGREPGVDLDLCDVCYWHKRAEDAQQYINEIKDLAVFIYNCGYSSGHNDTVEGCYVDIINEDFESYHKDVVFDIVKELIR